MAFLVRLFSGMRSAPIGFVHTHLDMVSLPCSFHVPYELSAFPALIYAFSGAAIGYSHSARPYAMAELLVVLTLYGAQRKSAWTGVVAACCIAVHYFAALCVAPIVMFYFYARWKADRRWAILTGSSFILITAFLLPLVLVHVKARPDQYAGAPASVATELMVYSKACSQRGSSAAVTAWSGSPRKWSSYSVQLQAVLSGAALELQPSPVWLLSQVYFS